MNSNPRQPIRRGTPARFFASLLRAGVFVLLLSVLAGSVPAATPDQASFRIAVHEGSSTAYGSGTGICDRLVVTNSHVVGHRLRAVLVVSPLIGRIPGEVVILDPAVDVAVIVTSQPVPWVAIGNQPQPGEAITMYGFGRDGVLKRAAGRILGRHSRQRSGAVNYGASVQSVQGDSGGGLFDSHGRLVAINWGQGERLESISVAATHAAQHVGRWIDQGLARQRFSTEQLVRLTQCFGQWCRPQQPGGSGGGEWIVSPKEPVVPQPITPPPQPPATIDYEKLAELVAGKIEPVQGPPGPPGPAGKDAELTPRHVDEIVARLANDARLRGPQGPPGRDGAAGPPGQLTQGQVQQISQQLLAALRDDPAFRGPAGPPGPAGRDGRSVGEADLDAIAEAVRQKVKGSIRYRVEPR